ncbi:MAG: hypothetical protein ACK55Z_15200, partial [bacterium]
MGASEALAEFIARNPDCLSLFDKPRNLIVSYQEMTENFQAEVMTSKATFVASEQVAKLRNTYRRILLEIAIFDLNQKNQVQGLPVIAKALADLAAVSLDQALRIARAELLTQDFGKFEPEEIQATELAVIGMGKG